MKTKHFHQNFLLVSYVAGFRRKLFSALIILALLVGIPNSIVSADPTLPLPRLPICGDQDGSESPFSFNCPDFVPTIDVQMYLVSGTSSRDFHFDFVFREASYNNELGFFKVDNASGVIGRLMPGDSGYLAAAFQRKTIIFPSGSTAYTPDNMLELHGNDIYVFFIIQNSTVTDFLNSNPNNDANLYPHAYFSVNSLNPDGVDHFIGFYNTVDGFTQFGFEDLTGGGDIDYDDIVFNINPPLHPSPPQPSAKPPLIIVHGWQGLPGSPTYHCSDGIQLYDGNVTNSTLGELPNWFMPDYQVFIAHLETSPSGTVHLIDNAKCLQGQIEEVYNQNPKPITIVAHSMGGLVSRAAINSLPSSINIDALYTMGSPHAGYPFIVLPYIKTKYFNDQAALDMVDEPMAYFNGAYKNKEGIAYYFIGGDATPFAWGLGWAILPFVGYNDGFVGRYSSVGWVWDDGIFLPSNWDDAAPPGQYWTDEVHVSSWGNSYYSAPPGDMHSFAYECIRALMVGQTLEAACRNSRDEVNVPQIFSAQGISNPSIFTELKTGHLDAGQTTSVPLDIDATSSSIFYFTYDTELSDAPTFTITRPDNQLIDSAYVITHPSEVTYKYATEPGGPQYAAYSFNTTQPGQWQLNISAIGAVDYQMFATFESHRILTTQTNADIYHIGELATITANLQSGAVDIAGATVVALLTRSDGELESVPLIYQGNGTYTANYTIPNAPGYLSIAVIANGSDNGTTFSRQENLLVAVKSDDLQLTGNYSDQPRDVDSDGLYDYLDFTLGVNLAISGEYAVSAELYIGDQLITQSGDFFNLTSGTQAVTLSFDGKAIHKAGLNGPYTVKNVFLTPLDSGVIVQSVENAWTTSGYSYTQFAGPNNPQVESITRDDANPTSAVSVDFTVSFSEVVTDVDSGDLSLMSNGISNASIQGVSGSGTKYTVTINTGSGNGTIRLDVVDDNTIIDAAGNPLGGINAGDGDFISGESYKIIKDPTFGDVQTNYWAWSYIERLYDTGVTSGCGNGNYCPTATVTRDQMAVFLLKGKHTSSYVPPTATGIFQDVPTDYWAAAWIEQLAAEGITSGCSVSPKQHCPTTPVTRDQMAVFLLKAKHGSGYVPPTPTGVFQDVPTNYWAAAWIEQLAAEGITAGCSVSPSLYCPTTPVTRDQMAVFLVKNFSLP